MGRLAVLAAALLAVGAGAEGAAAAQRFDGVKLSLASMNDQYSGPLVKLAPRAKADLGIDVNVDILSYPELLTKITADFVGDTKGYDLVTMDIVWAGQFAEAGHTRRPQRLDQARQGRARARRHLPRADPVARHTTTASRSPSRSPATPTCWPTARTSTTPPG